MRQITVPFLIVAAGGRAEMRRAVARGLNIEYEPILVGGRPAFLEWPELLSEAAGLEPAGTVGPEQEVLIADLARQFFDDLYAAVNSATALRKKDDQKIILFNRIIDLAREGKHKSIESACRREGLSARAIARVCREIALYQQKIESDEFSGAAVAHGYRNFLIQPGGHGEHEYFTGESQHRPYRAGRLTRYRNVARYFTPTEIIQQMVRLTALQSGERVIDITCGSGGFPAECVNHIALSEGDKQAQSFLTNRLVAVDDDPFCVSCTRELLTFLYPRCSDKLHVFLHNSLYARSPAKSEIAEEKAAEQYLRDGQYDLVIGNPPGNDEYSGTNRAEVAQLWAIRFGHTDAGLMDHHCFLRRAVELANPDGGRVCMLLPEGLLARDNRGMPILRQELMRMCELRAVISLPRVFRNNNARMSIVYLVRKLRPDPRRKVLMANVEATWVDENGAEQNTNVFGELEAIVDRYLEEL